MAVWLVGCNAFPYLHVEASISIIGVVYQYQYQYQSFRVYMCIAH